MMLEVLKHGCEFLDTSFIERWGFVSLLPHLSTLVPALTIKSLQVQLCDFQDEVMKGFKLCGGHLFLESWAAVEKIQPWDCHTREATDSFLNTVPAKSGLHIPSQAPAMRVRSSLGIELSKPSDSNLQLLSLPWSYESPQLRTQTLWTREGPDWLCHFLIPDP